MHALDFSIIIKKLPSLLNGCAVTLLLCSISLALALILGIVLALQRDAKHPLVSSPARFFIWIFRGTPLMVQLYLIYYGLPSFGIKLTAISAGILGMSLNTSAYIAEIIRSGIHAIDSGQREAAKALGMSPVMEMRRIVAPQATKVCLLPLVNQFVATIKNSSILSVITITELTRVGTLISYSTFRHFESYIAIAVLYLVLTTLFTSLAGFLERRLK
ncbi:amine acid ABC transporter, permease protein, 3-TM region, His/Glu/Gln/Arg/opine family [Sphaerochaeta pleomorpha str. Grapes]|uniref:Putative glutamine transport system permease protein GlnP n=1 Tax=Sphaerochaeta pleomorpha (strain ATCC BAA-1885 / DSM 22778 / Grapes) TaxID=158190 RepID=G8QUA6_SPHPG|nr:amino acid ABC transporter permease [Sphaerochaeta pleomorpha]AEV28076.1 amine acid ABC transporter, permease protein, 3-TM region, His/Glu/Gln/Arg/opine family [Sphaerochaeta pleomorpha str. Grapes]